MALSPLAGKPAPSLLPGEKHRRGAALRKGSGPSGVLPPGYNERQRSARSHRGRASPTWAPEVSAYMGEAS